MAVLIAATPACMMGPVNGRELADPGESVTFIGYSIEPEDTVLLQAYEPGSSSGPWDGAGQWVDFEETVASASATENFHDTDLFLWMESSPVPPFAWEPGAAGHQAYVRAFSTAAGATMASFENEGDATCVTSTSGWSEFYGECVSTDAPVVRLETQEFVPWVTVGDTTCEFGEPGCTACLDDVRASMDDVLLNNPVAEMNMEFHLVTYDPPSTGANHVQGYARLPDIVIESEEPIPPGGIQDPHGRVVISRDVPVGGTPHLFVFNQQVQSEYVEPWLYGWSGFLETVVELEGPLNHPGGIGVQGALIAVAIECKGYQDCGDHPAEVRFFSANGYDFELTEINRLYLDGSRGEPDQDDPIAAAVAFARLESGRYLLFVSGRSDGSAGGWFYVSKARGIGPDTEWNFLNYWEPPCDDVGNLNCWRGANGMSMITQCDGSLYLLGYNGDWEAGGGGVPTWVSVSRIEQEGGTGRVVPRMLEGYDVYGDNGVGPNDIGGRFGSNMFVTPNHTLQYELTERDISTPNYSNRIAGARLRSCVDEGGC